MTRPKTRHDNKFFNIGSLLITVHLTITYLIDHICLKYHFVIFVGDFNLPLLTEMLI